MTVRSASDYTSVQADGDLVLDGELALDVQGALAKGTVLTIMSGSVDRGHVPQPPREARLARGRLPLQGLLREQQRDADRHAGGAAEPLSTPLRPPRAASRHTTRAARPAGCATERGASIRCRRCDEASHHRERSMTQSLEIRSATDADAVPLCEFLNACTLVHQGISRSSPSDIVARLHKEGADPRFDSFVALDRDSIVGFAHVWAQGPDEVKLFARTHPDARGRGIGGRLLSLCDQRAAELLPGRAAHHDDVGGGRVRAGTARGRRLPADPIFREDGDRRGLGLPEGPVWPAASSVSGSPSGPTWPARSTRPGTRPSPGIGGARPRARPSSGRSAATPRPDRRSRSSPSSGYSRSTAARWPASASASSARARASRSGGSLRSGSSPRSAGLGSESHSSGTASESSAGAVRCGSCSTSTRRTRPVRSSSTRRPECPAARVHRLGEGGEVGGYRPSGTLRVTVVPPPGRLLI